MSEVRLNFLNWRPDVEDVGNDGLSVADNVVHETEGYKPTHLGSTGSFATTGGLAASAATIVSIVVKPVGAGDDLFCAWISGGTLNVGLNGVTATTATTGYPLSFGTVISNGEITVFDVCESYGKIYFVVEASQTEAVPATTPALRFQGYMDY